METPTRGLADVVGTFLEAPRWHDGRLWVSDMAEGRVLTSALAGCAEIVCELDDAPSGLGWLPDGDLVVVAMHSRRLLRCDAEGRLRVHADLSGLVTAPLNDMVIDAGGQAYVGSGGLDGSELHDGAVVRVNECGEARVLLQGLAYPNGLALDDNGVLLVAESLAQRLTEVLLEPDGQVGEIRTWASFGAAPTEGAVDDVLSQLFLVPDGICLDAEGCLWVADAAHGRAVRVRRGGQIVDEITVDTGVYACMLGGTRGRTLFLCTAPLRNSAASGRSGRSTVVSLEVVVASAGRP